MNSAFASTVRTKTITEYDRVEAGKLARKLRRENKIRLKELSAAMGVSIAYISQLEQGKKRWGPVVVDRFEKALRTILERNTSGV